jgi:hypothetical protein
MAFRIVSQVTVNKHGNPHILRHRMEKKPHSLPHRLAHNIPRRLASILYVEAITRREPAPIPQ